MTLPPHPNRQPQPYPHPYPTGHAYAPQPLPPPMYAPSHWAAPHSSYLTGHPGPTEPQFAVRVMKHTGLAIICVNQRFTITGTFAQCEAAIREAQLHNLLAGWWSVASVLVWNWVALFHNLSARNALRQQAIQKRSAADQFIARPPRR